MPKPNQPHDLFLNLKVFHTDAEGTLCVKHGCFVRLSQRVCIWHPEMRTCLFCVKENFKKWPFLLILLSCKGGENVRYIYLKRLWLLSEDMKWASFLSWCLSYGWLGPFRSLSFWSYQVCWENLWKWVWKSGMLHPISCTTLLHRYTNRVRVNSACMCRTSTERYVEYNFSLSMFVWVNVFEWLNLSG